MAVLRIGALATATLFLVTVKLECVSAARILLASPRLASHVMMQTSVGQELARRGHEVYVAIGSGHRQLESLQRMGLRPLEFRVPSDVPFGPSAEDTLSIVLGESIFSPDYYWLKGAKSTSATVSSDCEFMLTDGKFLERVRSLKFDVALVEPFVLNPCVLLLPHNLDIRFVSLTNFYLPWSIRLPPLPLFFYIGGPYATDTEPTLWNSLVNAVMYVGAHWVLASDVWNHTLLDRYSTGHYTWNELILKSELFLLSNDYHTRPPFPLLPNVIPVPGVTVRPVKPLPDDFEKLFTRSRDHGIILVTFGSMASHVPEPVVVKFLDAFSRLEQTVIARLSLAEGAALPENVHVFRWLPQNDILGDRRTRLFITHCGINGLYEAIYHGVPMLGFPLFAEQPANCAQMHRRGFGLRMNVHNFTSAELFANIQQLLDNDTYRDTVKRGSATLRDEPLFGPNKAAHWIEHVIKYGSAHLRSPVMDLPLYRFLMLDVLAVLIISMFVVVIVACTFTRVVTRTVWRKLTRQPNQKKLH